MAKSKQVEFDERKEQESKVRGHKSLFRFKVRTPASLSFTPAHHEMINAKVRELTRAAGCKVSRNDVLALLVEYFIEKLTMTHVGLAAVAPIELSEKHQDTYERSYDVTTGKE